MKISVHCTIQKCDNASYNTLLRNFGSIICHVVKFKAKEKSKLIALKAVLDTY